VARLRRLPPANLRDPSGVDGRLRLLRVPRERVEDRQSCLSALGRTSRRTWSRLPAGPFCASAAPARRRRASRRDGGVPWLRQSAKPRLSERWRLAGWPGGVSPARHSRRSPGFARWRSAGVAPRSLVRPAVSVAPRLWLRPRECRQTGLSVLHLTQPAAEIGNEWRTGNPACRRSRGRRVERSAAGPFCASAAPAALTPANLRDPSGVDGRLRLLALPIAYATRQRVEDRHPACRNVVPAHSRSERWRPAPPTDRIVCPPLHAACG
jgi:hypothetical protein